MNSPFKFSAARRPIQSPLLSEIPFEHVSWLLGEALALGHLTALGTPGGCVGGDAIAAWLLAQATSQPTEVGAGQADPPHIQLWPSTVRAGLQLKRMAVAAGAREDFIELIGSGQPFAPFDDGHRLRLHIEKGRRNPSLIALECAAPRREKKGMSSEHAWRRIEELILEKNVAVLACCEAARGKQRHVYERICDAALRDLASVVLVVSEDAYPANPDIRQYVLARCKADICNSGGGVSFGVAAVAVEGVVVPVVHHVEAVTGTAEDIMSEFEAPLGQRAREAVDWLRENITFDGASPQKLKAKATLDGIAWGTIVRCKGKAGVTSRRVAGDTVWYITLSQPDWTSAFAASSGQASTTGAAAGNGSWEAETPGFRSASPFSHGFGFQSAQSAPSAQSASSAQTAQPAQATGPEASNHPPESNYLHADSALYFSAVEAAVDLMENSTFDNTTPDPKRAVVLDVLGRMAPTWVRREDIILDMMGRVPNPRE